MDFLLAYSRYERIIISFIISINLVAFIFYGVDKLRAKKRAWRIPELQLILLGLLGGGLGSALAMIIFHHKLAKKKFIWGVPLMVILNFIGFLYLYPKLRGLV